MATDIIGFDIGHGQCSVAQIKIEGAANPENLNIIPGNKLITSHMLKKLDGSWIVDPTPDEILDEVEAYANNEEVQEAGIVFEDSIKEPIPLGENEDAKRNAICAKMRTFLKSLFNLIDSTNQPGVIPNPNYALYFACPSSWRDEEVAAYEGVINEAVRDYITTHNETEKTVKVIRESDAAYIASRKNWLSHGVPQNAHVLVIDFGSSTIDFTWYGDGKRVSGGANTGAAKVEKILFYYIINNDEKARGVYQEASDRIGKNNAKSIIITYLRKRKERFFSNLTRNNNTRFTGYDVREAIGDQERTYFGPTPGYNINKMYEILSSEEEYLEDIEETFNGKNYMNQVKQAFEDFKDGDNMRERTIDAVIITGGASRMPFVEEIAKEVFADALIIKDEDHDCDFVVSRGTAIWGRYHYLAADKLDAFYNKLYKHWNIAIENVESETQNNENSSNLSTIVNKWKGRLVDTAKDVYKDYIINILDAWTRDSKYSYRIGHNLKGILEPLKEELTADNATNNYWWKYLFVDLQKDENSLEGKRSIHSLLKHIYDGIDGNHDVIESINMKFNENLTKKIKGDIIGSLEDYYRVYFGENEGIPDEILNSIKEQNMNTGIQIMFTKEAKLKLLVNLINTTITYIIYSGGINNTIGIFSTDSFNKDRLNCTFGPKVNEIKQLLESPLENFVKTDLNPTFNDGEEQITSMISKYANLIIEAFQKIKEKCEGSLYTPNSSVSQRLFGDDENHEQHNDE